MISMAWRWMEQGTCHDSSFGGRIFPVCQQGMDGGHHARVKLVATSIPDLSVSDSAGLAGKHDWALQPDVLEAAVEADKAAGKAPQCWAMSCSMRSCPV